MLEYASMVVGGNMVDIDKGEGKWFLLDIMPVCAVFAVRLCVCLRTWYHKVYTHRHIYTCAQTRRAVYFKLKTPRFYRCNKTSLIILNAFLMNLRSFYWCR